MKTFSESFNTNHLSSDKCFPNQNLTLEKLTPCQKTPFFFQLWVAYAPCGSQHKDAVQVTLEQMDLIKRLAEAYPKHLKLVLTADGKERQSQRSFFVTRTVEFLCQLYYTGKTYFLCEMKDGAHFLFLGTVENQ